MKISTPNWPEWLAERKLVWQELDENMRYKDTKEMNDTLAAQKCWFIEGDLQPLMNNDASFSKEEALSLNCVLEFCPCTDIEEYTQFIKNYCSWLSQQKLDYWGRWYARRDQKLVEDLFSRFQTDNSCSTAKLHGHFLSLLMPDDDGKVIFPFSLGQDNWLPSATLSVSYTVQGLLFDLSRYLFSDLEDSNNYSHLIHALPFISRNLHKIDPVIFALELLEEGYEKEDGERVNSAGQEIMREVLGRLAGYNVEDEVTHHHDLEIEEQLREAFNTAKMPAEYYQLMDFIHLHKDDCVDPA